MTEKIYVCKECAEKKGVDVSTPYMYHICGNCGDGPTDLYEAEKSLFPAKNQVGTKKGAADAK